MANRDDISPSHEQVRLPERDSPTEHLSGPRHDKESVPILFELRTLVRLQGVLYR